jgi:hypothetical protein
MLKISQEKEHTGNDLSRMNKPKNVGEDEVMVEEN